MNFDINSLAEVQLKNPDDFLKVRETLTRIGVASKISLSPTLPDVIQSPISSKNGIWLRLYIQHRQRIQSLQSARLKCFHSRKKTSGNSWPNTILARKKSTNFLSH